MQSAEILHYITTLVRCVGESSAVTKILLWYEACSQHTVCLQYYACKWTYVMPRLQAMMTIIKGQFACYHQTHHVKDA